ncbi:LPS export ABC transporter permease LptF [Halorhodospira halochloris]|uniref:LPS export ABC transporter permease LptF n=1 Tax=Halorhodospira halochloris TaxID=1052 RepID=UPI001EE7C57A|nr:LPS export ABC transporter permease LptF [Halorhodospira halochloris]MCG5530988.1 LPS export ABC transporter permease LptF [Halorhodospira halochloris]
MLYSVRKHAETDERGRVVALIFSIIDRYLFREAAAASFAVFLVLFVVLAANRSIDYLADAAGGEIPAEAVAVLMGLQVLRYLGVVVPAALFIGMVLAMGRLYRDSELPVLAACGVGPALITRGLAYLAVPVAVLVFVLSVYVAPWASYQADVYSEQAARDVDLGAFQAGQFVGGGDIGTLYAGDSTGEGELREVFVYVQDADREVIVRADRAVQDYQPETGDRYLVFGDGYRYDGKAGQRDWTVTRFERHGLLVDTREAVDVERDREGTATAELIGSDHLADIAEVHWRLSMPAMVIVLTVLAVPLAKAEPRDGRYGKLLSAVLVYVAYFQLLTTGHEWLEEGRTPAELGLLWVHVAALLAALAWTRYRFGGLWPVRRSGSFGN